MNFIRKPNRLPIKNLYQKGYWYFVTICTQNRKCIFDMVLNGEKCEPVFGGKNSIIQNGDTVVNNHGDTVVASTPVNPNRGDTVIASTNIVEKSLYNLLEIHDRIVLDCWVIMPNHVHLIVGFDGQPISKITNKNIDLGNIIKSFKLSSQKQIVEATTVSPELQTFFSQNEINYHKIWQKSFYDRIIRNDKELTKLQEYIYNNPLQWELDELNPKNNYIQNGDTVVNNHGDTVVAATPR